ncbi:major facilitator superfamily transporter [Fusarium austroafricanum]|uniref:Major facilitator superfamily transporter n=1 Tax=Fusarium austroafricanum TaxID=2364996 RepID=A0A8H4KES2_9HYPO|nr:major facilitator superfamily transporter [Fusarium austroafricanum]
MIQPVLWPQMAQDMKLPITAFQHGQSANLAGLATGCALFVPLTVKYGRRSTYIISVTVMAAGCWWTAKRTTYAEVILTGIIVGWAGAINETVVQMTIADLYFIHQRGRANAFYQLAVISGGFLTPVAAGAQAAAHGWRWCYYTLGITQTILAVIFLFGYEETKYIRVLDGSPEHHLAALQVHKMENLSGENVEHQTTPIEPEVVDTVSREPPIAKNTYFQNMRFATPTSESLWRLFMAPASVVLLPHVLFAAIQYASAVCWLVFYSATSPIVFSAPPYLFTASGLGNMLLGPLVGSILGSAYTGLLSDRVVVFLAQRNGGLFEPEMRLHLLLPVIFTMAGGLIMYGTTAARGLHWIYPSIGGALYGFGFSAVGNIVFTMVIDTYYEASTTFLPSFRPHDVF